MTLDEHILDELAVVAEIGLTPEQVKLAMQERARALTTDTQDALIRLGRAGKIGFVGRGRWKLAMYCSPDLIRSHTGGTDVSDH